MKLEMLKKIYYTVIGLYALVAIAFLFVLFCKAWVITQSSVYLYMYLLSLLIIVQIMLSIFCFSFIYCLKQIDIVK